MVVWKADPKGLSQADLDACVALLRGGGLAAVPTETVYGLAVDAWQPAAQNRLAKVKGRAENKAFPIQFADLGQVERWLGTIPELARRLFERFSPGPVTVVFRPDPPVAFLDGSDGTVGVRIPDHPVMLQILRAFGGPLAVTSANRSGEAPAVDPGAVLESLGCLIDALVDVGGCCTGVASTVVDVTGEAPRILRDGGVSSDAVFETLADNEVLA